MVRFTFNVFWVFGWIFCWSPLVQAYIPPSQYIVKTWTNKHAGVKSIRIKNTVNAYDGNKATDVHFKDLSIYFPETQVLRSWALDDSDRKLYFTEKKLDRLSIVGKLLLSKDFHEVVSSLKEKGIPVRTEQELLAFRTESDRMKAEILSLARWNGNIIWTIGSSSSEKEAKTPQIWFEKDSFLPLRMFYSKSGSDVAMDVQFEGYKFAREFPYPKKVNVLTRGEMLLSSQLIEVATDSDRHHGGGNGVSGFTELGHSASSKVRQLISLYYEQLR
jgi:hypothetical protein